MKDTGTKITITFCDLLGLVFIILKLTNVITWSWLWVLAPIWGPIALLITILVGVILFTVIKRRNF